MQTKRLLVAALLATAAVNVHADGLAAPMAERASPTTVAVRWSGNNPIDVYVSNRPDAPLTKATLVSRADKDGNHVVTVTSNERPYFLLHDSRARQTLRVAERALPLEQGSNFRDLGGYAAVGGKHVKWGTIFRSGGTPLLTPADLEQVNQLHLREMFDLRSSEERVLSPTRIAGIRYSSVGYSMTSMFDERSATDAFRDIGAAYRRFPTQFAAQAREVFASLLRGNAPLAYNCSAGQDRTGFVTATVLSALGVSREVIYQDYHLSTVYRRPQYEMPKIDVAAHPGNPVATLFAQYQTDPKYAQPTPLYDPERKPLLSFAFEEIEKRWGSMDGYLAQEIGLKSDDIANLRARYLE
jgi:protein-tyrosine phosphatase